MDYLPLYSPEQARRHEVRPGVTGWAQVNGRNAIGWDEKFALNVWDVDHRSLALDIRIMALAARKIVMWDGISAEGSVTLERFTGVPPGGIGSKRLARYRKDRQIGHGRGEMSLAIYGPGGYGREVASFAKRQDEVVFVSDAHDEIGRTIDGVPVIGFAELAERKWPTCIAVADAVIRRRLSEKCMAAGISESEVWAPTSVRGYDTRIGGGAIMSDFTITTCNVIIGRHFHANIYSYIAHDCVIGDFVTLAPRVCINGNTVVEDDVYVGTGAVLKQGMPDKPLRIGRGAVIGMGAVVTKDVAPGAVVVGNPAKPLERR